MVFTTLFTRRVKPLGNVKVETERSDYLQVIEVDDQTEAIELKLACAEVLTSPPEEPLVEVPATKKLGKHALLFMDTAKALCRVGHKLTWTVAESNHTSAASKPSKAATVDSHTMDCAKLSELSVNDGSLITSEELKDHADTMATPSLPVSDTQISPELHSEGKGSIPTTSPPSTNAGFPVKPTCTQEESKMPTASISKVESDEMEPLDAEMRNLQMDARGTGRHVVWKDEQPGTAAFLSAATGLTISPLKSTGNTRKTAKAKESCKVSRRKSKRMKTDTDGERADIGSSVSRRPFFGIALRRKPSMKKNRSFLRRQEGLGQPSTPVDNVVEIKPQKRRIVRISKRPKQMDISGCFCALVEIVTDSLYFFRVLGSSLFDDDDGKVHDDTSEIRWT